MKFIVTIQHPAHVHFFKHGVRRLRDAGHEVHVFVREKDVAVDLLDAYGVEHTVLAGSAAGPVGLAAAQARYEYRLLREARRIRPDVITAIGGMAAAHVAALTGARCVVFTDSELPSNRVVVPFADLVCTPRGFREEYGSKHLRYDGFHELAYLHPSQFDADPAALREHGVDPDADYAVCRFSDMRAHHDVGAAGLSPAAKREIVSVLADRGDVYVAAEGDVDAFAEHALPVPPHRLHDLLAHADLVVTDSSTTATEAGLLGTPALRSNSFAGPDDMGNFVELEERGLVRSTPDEDAALDWVRETLADPGARATWERRRDDLLAEKVDVTAFAASVLTSAADPNAGRPDTAEVGARA